ncbi:hypothetical protein EYF80_065711 [Liparis tanakae]|uniref:Uncharacterized protein n=1 Tax=Liparis tanakae TaxID=230148 RepID=A0A4Z2E5G8_9TELE|nr:hypothetical protein EYF80_065711 [Liparis tanakae]
MFLWNEILKQRLRRLHLWSLNASAPHLMILLQAPHSGVLPPSSVCCAAACRMELRFCMGVGRAGCRCCVSTVLVLSGRKRSAKFWSVTHGGRDEGPDPPGPPAAFEPEEPHTRRSTTAQCVVTVCVRACCKGVCVVTVCVCVCCKGVCVVTVCVRACVCVPS